MLYTIDLQHESVNNEVHPFQGLIFSVMCSTNFISSLFENVRLDKM